MATQYAGAFVTLAQEKNVLDDVRADMDSVQALIKAEKGLIVG